MLTNFNALRLEVARNTRNHVKKTLPPSLNGLPGEAEIRYFVKVTVQRPAFYKENFRSVSAHSPLRWPKTQVYQRCSAMSFIDVDGRPCFSRSSPLNRLDSPQTDVNHSLDDRTNSALVSTELGSPASSRSLPKIRQSRIYLPQALALRPACLIRL